MGLGVVKGIQRGVDDLDFGALSPGGGQGLLCTGDADQVAEGGDGRVLLQGQVNGLVDEAHRRHADRAARPGNQVDFRGQDPADPQAEDLVGVGPADLHDPKGLPIILGNDINRFALGFFTHQNILSISSSDSVSSSSVILAMAQPAWTMT